MILPPRPLTDAEARGFAIACGCFATWGRQIADAATLARPHDKTGALAPTRPEARAMRDFGRRLGAMAQALERRLGRSSPP